MLICVDESGRFAHRPSKSVVDCVGAVVIPDSVAEDLLGRFSELDLRRDGADEVKGSGLHDSEIATVARMVHEFPDALVFVEGLDMQLTRQSDVRILRQQQGDAIVANVPDYATDFVKADTANSRREVLALSDPLFLQFMLMTFLAEGVLRWATAYYALHRPEELSRFAWRIDPKQPKARTRYERLWTYLVPALLQARTLREPLAEIIEGDYSRMRRFDSSVAECPEYLRPLAQDLPSPFRAFDVKAILGEDREFPDSRTSAGVRLADVLVHGLRRAFNGDVTGDTARALARVVVRRPDRIAAIRLVGRDALPASAKGTPTWLRMVKTIDAIGRVPL